MDLTGDGINPMDYIKIPDYMKSKYHSKTYGANTRIDTTTSNPDTDITTVMPEDDSNEVIQSPDFKPVSLDTVDKKLIDSVEVKE